MNQNDDIYTNLSILKDEIHRQYLNIVDDMVNGSRDDIIQWRYDRIEYLKEQIIEITNGV